MPKPTPTIQKIFTLPLELDDKFTAMARLLEVSQTELFRRMVKRVDPADLDVFFQTGTSVLPSLPTVPADLASHNLTLPMTPGERASVIQDMRRRPDTIPLDPTDLDIAVRGPHVAAPADVIPQTLAQATIPVFPDDEHAPDDELSREDRFWGRLRDRR